MGVWSCFIFLIHLKEPTQKTRVIFAGIGLHWSLYVLRYKISSRVTVLQNATASEKEPVLSCQRSRLLLFSRFSWAKSINFIKNPHDLEFCVRAKDFSTLISQLVQVGDSSPQWQQKASGFKSDFCGNCASYIITLLTIDNGPFCPWNFTNVNWFD